ncbi:MAG: hypothetical protein ABJN24_05530 [Hyphomicrobiales bacterium]
MPTINKKVAIALLLVRLSIGAFFAIWASLKFLRPKWMEKVFHDIYQLEIITQDHALALGLAQSLVVFLFIIGMQRTYSYGLVIIMHGIGVMGAIPLLLKFTHYPSNLLWTAVPTLGAMIALFYLREYDIYTVDGWQDRAF